MKTLFLLGCERSGTTFVSQTLSKYYDIAQHGTESLWPVIYWHEFNKLELDTVEKQEKFLNSLFYKSKSGSRFFAALACYQQIYIEPQKFLQPGVSFDYSKFIEAIFHYMASLENKNLIMNKTCEFCEHMMVVDKIFQQPKVLSIIRDGRDVATSLLVVKGWGPKTIYGAAQWWTKRVNAFQKYAESHMQGRYLQVHYEELIEDPSTFFEKITQFYGIYEENRHQLLVNSIQLKKQNSNKWKTKLSSKQIFLFERIAHQTLLYHKYPLMNSVSELVLLSKKEHFYFRIKDFILSRFAFYTLWRRSLLLFIFLLGKISPSLQKKFYRSQFFQTYFHWNRIIRIKRENDSP